MNAADAALTWAKKDEARDQRPALSLMVKKLAEEHKQMQRCIALAYCELQDGESNLATKRLKRMMDKIGP